MDAKILGTIGLVLDIIGAILVAFEVVKVYRGQIVSNLIYGNLKPAEKFKEYENKKHRMMKIGLCFLIVGFLMQIIAIWIK